MSLPRCIGFCVQLRSSGLDSRTWGWSEHAPARAVGPAANPHFSVWARRRLFERHKFRATDDPALAGHGDPVGRVAVVVAATPLARRISIGPAIDPGVVSRPRRRGRQRPSEREPEERDPAQKSMSAGTHPIARELCRRQRRNMFSAETYVSCPPPACSTLLSLVRPCHILPPSAAVWTRSSLRGSYCGALLEFSGSTTATLRARRRDGRKVQVSADAPARRWSLTSRPAFAPTGCMDIRRRCRLRCVRAALAAEARAWTPGTMVSAMTARSLFI
jgi:hypothetical protein